MQTPFRAMYKARMLEYEIMQLDNFAGVFSSSNIKMYPYQIAAASFALNAKEQNGVVLCDESGMGKSHEAMLVVAQKYIQGNKNIFIATPKADLIKQWADCIDKYYTLPYTIIETVEKYKEIIEENKSKQAKAQSQKEFFAMNKEAREKYDSETYFKLMKEFLGLERSGSLKIKMTDPENPFTYDGIILTTYDVLAEYSEQAKKVNWDLCVFDEANALSNVYQESNNKAKILKDIAGYTFKILLTGTPIEKNIMDLYGLIYFIDENALMKEQEFLHRYLRKPENYPELSKSVSKYCFRTLRSQAKRYVKIPKRINITLEYEPTKQEKIICELLYNYTTKENKVAFPEMNVYDLSLKLLGILSSSTVAMVKTLENIIDRLKMSITASEEINELENIVNLAKLVKIDSKTKSLIKALPVLLKKSKELGGNKKAVIFTENNETQNYLFELLKDKYKVEVYNSNSGYDPIERFKNKSEILIANDSAAKGFNLEECCVVINYDLLFNSLKMEQRIDRCHRLNQDNDVFAINFINKNNMSDVRKLELMSKRHLVTSGVVGLSDSVIGGFTTNLEEYLTEISDLIRTKEQIELEYNESLNSNQKDNTYETENAEDILFTTFTKELADKIKIVPKVIEDRAKQLNDKLWELAKFYFEYYNSERKNETNCYFIIDEEERTITASDSDNLPFLSRYYSNGRNVPYITQKKYSMSQDFKPKYGIISITSKIGQIIIDDMECAQSGELKLKSNPLSCKIGLYGVKYRTFDSTIPILVGLTKDNQILNHQECENLLDCEIESYEEQYSEYFKRIYRTAHWLNNSPKDRDYDLERLIDTKKIVLSELEKSKKSITDQEGKIKLEYIKKKIAIKESLSKTFKTIESLKEKLTSESDRMERLKISRQLAMLENEKMKAEETIFFKESELDAECENLIMAEERRNLNSITLYVDFTININSISEGVIDE